MAVEQNGIRRVPKLNGASNYRAWSTVIRSVLRSYLLWDIVSGVEVMPPGSDKAGDETSKTSGKEKSGSSSTSSDTSLSPGQSWLKRDAEASSFILCMIEFALLDDIDASSTSKQLWDYLQSQYGEKGFTLRHNLFIHLMTTKLNEYPSVEEYQLNFKSTLRKLHESGAPLPKDLQLAAFLHGVEETYSQWAFAKRSTIRSKAKDEDLPTIDDLTAELLDESRITVAVEAKALAASRANHSRRNSNKARTRCTFCEKEGHEKDNCWRKHPEKRPARFKNQDSTNQASINQDSSDDERIPKGKRKEGKFFGAAAFVRPLMSMASTASTTKSRRYRNAWLLDSGASVHMCNSRATFTDYRVLESPTDIQSMGGPVQAIGIGTACVSFILPDGTTTDTSLQETFHVPDLFTNLISLGVLLKKGYSFDTRTFYVLDKSNQRVVYAPLQDNLFPVKVVCKKAEHSKPTKFDHLNPSQARTEHAPSSRNLAPRDLKRSIERPSHPNPTPILGSEQQVAAHTISFGQKDYIFASQGGAPVSGQGVLKPATPVFRSSHDFWHQIWRNGCAPVGA